jgi:hypothetical protein
MVPASAAIGDGEAWPCAPVFYARPCQQATHGAQDFGPCFVPAKLGRLHNEAKISWESRHFAHFHPSAKGARWTNPERFPGDFHDRYGWQ